MAASRKHKKVAATKVVPQKKSSGHSFVFMLAVLCLVVAIVAAVLIFVFKIDVATFVTYLPGARYNTTTNPKDRPLPPSTMNKYVRNILIVFLVIIIVVFVFVAVVMRKSLGKKEENNEGKRSQHKNLLLFSEALSRIQREVGGGLDEERKVLLETEIDARRDLLQSENLSYAAKVEAAQLTGRLRTLFNDANDVRKYKETAGERDWGKAIERLNKKLTRFQHDHAGRMEGQMKLTREESSEFQNSIWAKLELLKNPDVSPIVKRQIAETEVNPVY